MVNKGIKLNCYDFMEKTYFTCYKSQSRSFKVMCVFLHDNASQVSKLAGEFFEHKRFTVEKIMEWLPSCPGLNPIVNLWSM